jgi:hypothetical protein
LPATRDDLALEGVRSLFDASHEGYSLYRCKQCGQPYLEQFHEIIDWSGGNDDIWIRWIPLTPEEVAEVDRLFPAETANAANVHVLTSLMHRRRRLTCHPDGKFFWSDDGWDGGDLLPPG